MKKRVNKSRRNSKVAFNENELQYDNLIKKVEMFRKDKNRQNKPQKKIDIPSDTDFFGFITQSISNK